MSSSDAVYFHVDYSRLLRTTTSFPKCSAILLDNLANIQWIKIDCGEKLLQNVLCEGSNSNLSFHREDNVLKVNSQICKKYSILQGSTCIFFKWHTNGKLSAKRMNVQPVSLKTEKDIQKIEPVFLASMVMSFPPVFSEDLNYFFTVDRVLDKFLLKIHKVPKRPMEGFYLERHSPFTQTVEGKIHVVKCPNARYISPLFVCNAQSEVSCVPNYPVKNSVCHCSDGNNVSLPCKGARERLHGLCSPLMYRSKQGNCFPFVPQRVLDRQRDTAGGPHSLKCENGDCVAQRTNLGSLTENLETTGLKTGCSETHQFPCTGADSNCFNVSDLCAYKFDKSGYLTPCRAGKHLSQCQNFECNMMFKCPMYYCIMWQYVCDGKWDCPFGTDELSNLLICDQFLMCKNMFKCTQSSSCLHLGQICDQASDCPLGDDELVCFNKDIFCPQNCICLVLAVTCNKETFSPNFLWQFVSFKSILIVESVFKGDISSTLCGVHNDPKILVFTLTKTNISSFCQILCRNIFLSHIDVSYNMIERTNAKCFAGVSNLKTIVMSHNCISKIDLNTFRQLKLLQLLNISHNPLNVISGSFTAIKQVFVLSLCIKNDKVHIDHQISTEMGHWKHLELLQTNDYRLCCFVPENSLCTENISWYLSCAGLLNSKALKTCFMVTSCLLCVINVVCFCSHSVSTNRVQTASNPNMKTGSLMVMVGAVNIADLFCAIPLFIVWIADATFQETFILSVAAWGSGTACYLSLSTTLFFDFTSPALLCLLSVQRLELVKHPIDTKYKEQSFVLHKALMVCGLCLVLTSLTVSSTILNAMLVDSYISAPICSPFLDPAGNLLTMKVSLLVVRVWH